MIQVTRTNACVLNIPFRPDMVPRAALPIVDIVDAFVDPPSLVPLLNTSRATSSMQARQMIDYGLRAFAALSGVFFRRAPLLKLEILNRDLLVLDDETLSCLRQLEADLRCRTVPILSPNPGAVAEAVKLGCPAVRLLSGRIGQRTGILHPSVVSAAIARAEGRPAILEGGIDTADHIRQSAELGAAGVLMNSAFRLAPDPVARARELRQAADSAWQCDLCGSPKMRG